MSESFSAFCARIGLPLKNERWSWCALNEDRRQAVFTIWEDRLDRPHRTTIDLSWLNDPARTENGAREFRRVMARVREDRFTAYGILCEARDVDAHPRARKRFDPELLVLNVTEENGKTIARVVGRVAPEAVLQECSVIDALDRKRSALDDLDAEFGKEQPRRREGLYAFFVRDVKLRNRVIHRSKGMCEHCGVSGFEKADGSRYVEAHHIISLADQGCDTLANVIALCPSHHREAHYGVDRVALEQAFLKKLEQMTGNQS